jgi:hypothetical protein
MTSEYTRYGNLPVFTRILDKIHPGLGSDRGFDIDRKNTEIKLLGAQTKALEKIARQKIHEYKENRIIQETAKQYSPNQIQQIPSYTPENLARDINESLLAHAQTMQMDNELTREIIAEIGADLHKDLVTIEQTAKLIVKGVFDTNEAVRNVDKSISTLTDATNLQTGYINEQTNLIQAEAGETRNQLQGISSNPLNLQTLENLTNISEVEIISLCLRNILNNKVFYDFLKNLESWKQKIVFHIINYDDIGHDPVFEKNLNSIEKTFLNDLRIELKTDLRPATLGYLARHGFLDRFVQDEAGKHISEVRTDIYGLNQNVQDVISGLKEVTATIIWTEEKVRETLETIYTGIQDQTQNWHAHRKNERLEQEAIPLIKIGEFEDALDALDDARKLNRFDPRSFLYKGIIFMLTDDTKSAEAELKKALIRAESMDAPQEVKQEIVSEICTYLGRLKHKLAQRALEVSNKDLFGKEISESIKNAEIAFDNSLKSPEKYFDLARYLCVNNEYEEALDVIKKLLREYPESLKSLLEEKDFTPISSSIIKINEEMEVEKEGILKKEERGFAKKYWENYPTDIEGICNWIEILYLEKNHKEINSVLEASINADCNLLKLLQKMSKSQEGREFIRNTIIFYYYKIWKTNPESIKFCLEEINLLDEENDNLNSEEDLKKIIEKIQENEKIVKFTKLLCFYSEWKDDPKNILPKGLQLIDLINNPRSIKKILNKIISTEIKLDKMINILSNNPKLKDYIEEYTKKIIKTQAGRNSASDVLIYGMGTFSNEIWLTAKDFMEQLKQTEILQDLLIKTEDGHKKTALAIRENSEILSAGFGEQIKVTKEQLAEQRQTNVILNQMSFIMEDGFQAVEDAIERGTREIKAELQAGFNLTTAAILIIGKNLEKTIIDTQKIDLLEAIQDFCIGQYRNPASAVIANSFFNDDQLFSAYSLVQKTDPLILKTVCRLRGGMPGEKSHQESNKIKKLQDLAFNILTNNFQNEDGSYKKDDKGRDWDFHHIASPEDLLELLLLYQNVDEKIEIIFKQLHHMRKSENNIQYDRFDQNKAKLILHAFNQLDDLNARIIERQIKHSLEHTIPKDGTKEEIALFKKKIENILSKNKT